MIEPQLLHVDADAVVRISGWGPLAGARQGMRSAPISRVARARRADIVRFTT